MLGKIEIEGQVAIMNDDGVWECGDETLTEYLNTAFDPNEATGLDALLPFGVGNVIGAATEFGVPFDIEPIPKTPMDQE